MKNIAVITNKDFKLKSKIMHNPTTRVAARGIVIRDDGKIAIFNKSKKNEYKLPGGGIENNESIKSCFTREVLEETGCKVEIIKELGTIEEYRENDNFKQISHVFEARVVENENKLHLTKKEKNEGGRILWVTPEEGLTLIKKCIDNLKPSKYENLYHTKFIVTRDKLILEYYLNNKNKNTKWSNLYSTYIDKEYDSFDEYFKTKMRLKKKFINLVKKYSENKPILECGCGTGKTAVYLASLGLKSYAMDKEKEMVLRTQELSNKFCKDNQVIAFEGDIKKIPYKDKFFSVTHSSGVLEHYMDHDIVELINEQLRVSDYCIFSVPTSYFEKKMLGNERFMIRREWRKIISNSKARIIKETGYHYKSFGNRVIDIIKKPKRLFKPIALYVFLLREEK